MSAYRHARLQLNADGSSSSIEVEGQNLTGVRRLDLSVGVGEPPRLVLHLLMGKVDIDGQVRVDVPDKTREDLITLGWTPPEAA